MTLPVEIVNETIHFVQQSDSNTVNLVYATWAIAFATIIGIGITTWYTRRSLNESKTTNRLLKEELESDFRPRISRHVHNKKKYDLSQINDDTCSFLPEKVMFHIINNGKLPAIDVHYKYYIEPRDSPSTAPILNPRDSTGSKKESSLAPSEYYSLDIPFNIIGMYGMAINDVKCYFGMIIWYSDENKRRYYYHMEGFFNKGVLMLNHVDMGIST